MKPFTYLIGWSTINKFYYGVKYAKNSNPADLWTKYFTSSKHVKQIRNDHGEPDIIQVRKVFNSVEKARNWECKVLTRLNVIHNEKWINATNNKSISPIAAGHSKGKTYEQMYGEERAKVLKNKRALSSSTRIIKPETRLKQSNSMKNKIPWNKGIPRTEEEKQKMRGPRTARSKEAIEASRQSMIGRKRFRNPKTGQNKMFFPNEAPKGWIKTNNRKSKDF